MYNVCTKVGKNIVGLKTAFKCAFVCNRDKESPFLSPLFLSAAFFVFVFRSRVSHESLHRSSSRASDFFSLSRASLRRAPSVRPSAHNTPLGCVWYYCHCQLVVASGASGGTFSRLFLSLSRPPHFALKSLSKLQKDNVFYAGVFGNH